MRPAVVILSLAAWVTLLAVLGFAPSSQLTFMHGLNDRWLHAIAFCVLALLLYHLFRQRHLSGWDCRAIRASLLVSFMLGLGSECVQGLLPWRSFDVVDLMCDIAGSVAGLVVAVLFERPWLHRNRFERVNDDVVLLASL